MKKRLIALLCAIWTILSLCPMPVAAATADDLVAELDAALLRDNSVMDNVLAVNSARLSRSAYDNFADAILSLGFEGLTANYFLCKEGEHHVAYSLGRKELKSGGQTYYAYVLVIRGTTGVPEWLSNFDSGSARWHLGFLGAALKVLTEIRDKNLINTPKEQNILWITGHSRGAAVANLIAEMVMVQKSLNKFPTDAVHAYTFACPNVDKKPNTSLNIYNFNFKEDVVPKLPLADWGYGRHGKTYTTKFNNWMNDECWSEKQVNQLVDWINRAIWDSQSYANFYTYLMMNKKQQFVEVAKLWTEFKYLSAIDKLLDAVQDVIASVNIYVGTNDLSIDLFELKSALTWILLDNNLPSIGALITPHQMNNYVKWIENAYPINRDTGAAGDYAAQKTGVVVRSGPYSECDDVGSLSYGQCVPVLYSLVNSKGRTWYKLGGDYAGYYIYSENIKKISSFPVSSLTVSADIQHKDMRQGTTNKLVGVIRSNYALGSVSATLDGNMYADFSTQATSVNIPDTTINSINFSALPVGRHTIEIVAKDVYGGIVSRIIDFTVSNVQVNTPTLSVSDYVGGKTVYLSSSTSGAVIYYTTNGQIPTAGSTRYTAKGIDLTDSATIRAIAVKEGVSSGVLTRYISVVQTANPVISSVPTAEGSRISITAESGATIYYSAGGEYGPYYAPFTISENAVIRAYSEKAGSQTSSTVTLNAEVFAPNVPSILSPVSGSKVAQGSAVTVRWSPVGNAHSYTVMVERNGEVISTKMVTEANATFLLNDQAETSLCYTFSVKAHNRIGDSVTSEAVTVESMPPCSVRFVDWDGTVLSEQQVNYGSDAVAPKDPSRKGHYFRHWDVSFTAVTSDLVVSPVYQIITYTVKFLDSTGRTIDTQSIPYMESASAPLDAVELPVGYKFLGWSISAEASDSLCDLEKIDSNMTAKAIVGWADAELPLIAEIVSAQRNDDEKNGNYAITVRLTNTPDQYTTALLRVTLKTAEGKMVKTESRTVGIGADISETYLFTLNYSGTATKVEVVALGYNGDYLTGAAVSKAVSSTVEVISGYVYNEWSDWSTEKPEASVEGREIESKTQYRYKEKLYTTSSSSSMSGWTRYDVQSQWSAYGAWSDWSTTAVTATDYVKVEKATQHRYYRCKCNNSSCNTDWYGGRYCSNCGSYIGTYQYLWSFTAPGTLDASGAFDWGFLGSGAVGRTWGLDGNTGYWYYYPGTSNAAWKYQTRTVYRSQSRSLLYTYYYWKWGDFSDWQDSYVASTGENVVETRTVYRYRDQSPVYSDLTGSEDNSGNVYTFTNIFDETRSNDEFYHYVPNSIPDAEVIDLAGKLATVMVYKGKNSDPNESQLQYVGQITIGSENSFSFDFKTKDAPSETTGDYVVCLSVQGSTGLVNIGMIERPRESYTVNFYDSDGTLIDSQSVEAGKNAVMPDVPEKEGYAFVSWSESGTNICGNTDITAIYVPRTYAVAFVDWVNGSAIPVACEYGTDLVKVAETITPYAEGQRFIGWDCILDGNTTVTDNMVVSAVFEAETYTVTFYDGEDDDKEAVSTQTVSYGQSAVLPEAPVYAEKEFLGWSTDETWWQVTSDMDVYPITTYTAGALMPTYSISQSSEDGTFWLTLAAEATAVIYYTLDGSDPVPGENGLIYAEPIKITNGQVVRAIAVVDGKNPSESIDAYVDLREGNSYVSENEMVEVGTYSPIVNSGDEIILNVRINNNPGLMGYYFIIECDPTVYSLTCGEDSSYECVAGDVIGNGTMLVAPEPGVGWRVLWFDTSVAEGDGTLFTAKFKVSEEAQPGAYSIKVSYSAGNMLGENYLETRALVEGSVSGAAMQGDITGDGAITLADVIGIARHIVGLDTISGIDALIAADVNADGDITTADVVKLARRVAGLE